MKVLIVDDEAPARERLQRLCAELDGVELREILAVDLRQCHVLRMYQHREQSGVHREVLAGGSRILSRLCHQLRKLPVDDLRRIEDGDQANEVA